MSEKIVGLRGREAPVENGAEPTVIATLEEALEEARRGDIRAICVVKVRSNGSVDTVCDNPGHDRHSLVAGVAYMLNDLCKERDE